MANWVFLNILENNKVKGCFKYKGIVALLVLVLVWYMCRRIQNCHNACQNKVMSDVPKFLFAQLLETKTKNNLSLKENLRACASSKTSFLPGVMWQQLLGKLYHHTSIPSSYHHTSLPSYQRPSFHNISTPSYHNHPTIPVYHHHPIVPHTIILSSSHHTSIQHTAF